jgi:hypothetical protein
MYSIGRQQGKGGKCLNSPVYNIDFRIYSDTIYPGISLKGVKMLRCMHGPIEESMKWLIAESMKDAMA